MTTTTNTTSKKKSNMDSKQVYFDIKAKFIFIKNYFRSF